MQGTRVGPGDTPTCLPARGPQHPPGGPQALAAHARAPGCIHAIGLVRGCARAADAPSWQASPTVSRAERAEPGAVRPREAGTHASGRGRSPQNPGLP